MGNANPGFKVYSGCPFVCLASENLGLRVWLTAGPLGTGDDCICLLKEGMKGAARGFNAEAEKA